MRKGKGRKRFFFFFFLYFFDQEKRPLVQKTEREEHVLLWEEHYSIRVEKGVEKRERVYSYSHMRIFKRTDTVSWPALLHFSKKIFSLPSPLPNFLPFSNFLYFQFPSSPSPLFSLVSPLKRIFSHGVATLSRVKINLSLQNFLFRRAILTPLLSFIHFLS